MKRILLLLFILCGQTGYSQSARYLQESAFSRHLITNNLYNDGILFYRQVLADSTLLHTEYDTLYYRLGLCFEKTGQTDSSISAYQRVGNYTTLYEKSISASLTQYVEAGRYRNANNFIMGFGPREMNQLGYKIYWQAATSFLHNDTTSFFRDSLTFRFTNGDARVYTDKFQAQLRRIDQVKKKSPALAASLSAIVPGLGKVYAGRPRHGLAAFMPCAVLGVQAFEAYRKGGVKDPRFLVYSSLFSVFYIGNIYGSALTVKAVRNETINDARYRIQADLILSLDRFSR